MRIAAGSRGSNRVQRLSLIAAIGVGALAFTGCSAINPQSTTMVYSPSDGVRADFGKLELRNMLIASNGSGKPGRIVGAIYNTSDSPITLTITGTGGSQAQVEIKPGAPYMLNGTVPPAVLSHVAEPAGGVEPLTLAQTGPGEQTTTLKVPVLDGTLPEYATLIPTPSAAAPAASPSASATPAP